MNNKFSILIREMRNVLFIFLISISGLFAQSSLLFSPKPTYFGHISVGSKAERDISLFNVSTSNMQVSQISISGTNSSNSIILINSGISSSAGTGRADSQVIEIPGGYAFVATNEPSNSNFDIYLTKIDFNAILFQKIIIELTNRESMSNERSMRAGLKLSL